MNKIASLGEYFSSILRQYYEAQKNLSPPTLYRLVDVKEKANHTYELLFQLIGKAVLFKTTPEEILKNEKMIEHFSSKDIRFITQLAYKTQSLPKNKIIGKSFSQKLNKLLFKIKDLCKGTVTEASASTLSIDKEFIQNLAPEDAHTIGYAAAMEMIENEKIAVQELSKNKTWKWTS